MERFTASERMPDEHEKLQVVGGLAALGNTESMSLNEKAYQLIRLDILTFRLKPGEKTSEQLLAGPRPPRPPEESLRIQLGAGR
jgi:hypothetical protein